MYDAILVPTDGSDEVRAAVEHGFELARQFDATLHALYVVNDTSGGAGLFGADQESAVSRLEDEGEIAVADIADRGADAGIEVVTAVRRDLPHEGILAYADEHDIDVLVMSSHGRSGVSRVLFGSVTERVLRLTDRPVLVVAREGPETDAE